MNQCIPALSFPYLEDGARRPLAQHGRRAPHVVGRAAEERHRGGHGKVSQPLVRLRLAAHSAHVLIVAFSKDLLSLLSLCEGEKDEWMDG